MVYLGTVQLNTTRKPPPVMTSQPPTFILGVGAQKSGTTWLHKYLSLYDYIDFGAYKEYHIWDHRYLDGIYQPGTRSKIRNFLKYYIRLALRKVAGITVFPDLRYDMIKNDNAYFSYFEKLLAAPDISTTGDITPIYSALSQDVLQNIKSEFSKRGIRIKVVFLMRDPVERCWSCVRMHKKRNSNSRIVDIAQPDDIALLSYMKTLHAQQRTAYHKTLENLMAVFDPSEVFTGIYENLFTPAEITRLSQFIGVAPNLDFAKTRVNASAKSEHISPETRQQAHEQFAEVYAYCFKHFPETKTLWRGYPSETPASANVAMFE